jgi:GntR family transcriptional regulator
MEFKDKQAIYIQIADYVCEQLLLGIWPQSDRIPSVRDLAATLEVNPNTVMRTYEYLQGKNIIYNKRGVGYFTDEQATDRIREYRKERFLDAELPEFFRTLYLLDIHIDELQKRYKTFIEQAYPATL